jgi:CrcB protein
VRVGVAIAVAGALGALARYGLDSVVPRRAGGFPWAIFVVNVTGAFALGVVLTAATTRAGVAPWLRTAATVGFLGAYTTFSTLAFDTYRLAADRALGLAAANMLGSCAAGLAAVYLGVVVGRAL